MEEENVKSLRGFTEQIIASQPARRKPEHKQLTERYAELAKLKGNKGDRDPSVPELKATIADLERQIADLQTDKREAAEPADELDNQVLKLRLLSTCWGGGGSEKVRDLQTDLEDAEEGRVKYRNKAQELEKFI
ncbi:hypothetical protein QFC21_004408 [Naganishia friedmannii]|uniref:Uncharacterized protein n=1 Tax=Naganishia friedmannii TaxID=89922 RepID=A0ACC2VIN9_9TREE|nr:hypothetical protein QFC21_004408 [Naganishia friedmannii]